MIVKIISKQFFPIAIILWLLGSSCATPPGKIIGDTVCECLQKTGGERPKIKICMEQFQKDVKAELTRQNVPEGAQNDEASRAMNIMRLCMRAVSGWDTLRQMQSTKPHLPSQQEPPQTTPPE